MPMKQTFIHNPITALRALPTPDHGQGSQILLAGEGAVLKIYDTAAAKLVGCCRIFTSQVIHGIAFRDESVSGEKSIVIWGGRSFTFLTREDINAIIAGDGETIKFEETLAADWILDAAFSPSSQDLSCVFITAHNEAVQVSLADEQSVSRMKTLSSPSRSILYSAHVTWISDKSIMVASGTVFGEIEIIVWSMDSEDKSESGSILTTFTGHEGSIFGVQISPELKDANGDSIRILASCSDDRTIRLWDLSTLDLSLPVANGVSKLSIRETGFGGKETEDAVSAVRETRCIAKAMGHASRIWKVRFIVDAAKGPSKATPFNILSFGEDCTVQQWVLNGWPGQNVSELDGDADKLAPRAEKGAALTHLGTHTNHIGKHIWATALVDLASGLKMVVTGGADGAIATFEVGVQRGTATGDVDESSSSSDHQHFKSTVYTPAEILEQFGGFTEEPVVSADPVEEPVASADLVEEPDAADKETPDLKKKKKKAKKAPVAKKDAFSKYAFVNGTDLLFTTAFGKVVVQSTHESSGWKECPLPVGCENSLRSYSVVASLSNQSAVLAGIAGNILLYTPALGVQELTNLDCKVAGLFELPGFVAGSSSVLATTLGQSQAYILTFDSNAPQKCTQSSIELPPSFIVTSAGIIDELLVIGCRSGRIAVYDIAVSASPMSIIIDKSFDCHDAITRIIPVPNTDSTWAPHFLITARNGKYGIFTIHAGSSKKERTLELLHYSQLPFGPMIEGAQFINSSLIIHGFHSTHFIAWDETTQREVLNVNCGGAHRNYAFTSVSGVQGKYVFAYTKASTLSIHTQHSPAFNLLKSGAHGRELKAAAISSDAQLLATASEDTTIRISAYSDLHNPLLNSLTCHAVLRKHSAGIQHLQWAETAGGKGKAGGKYLFSGGGAEEFCVWAVRWIPGFGMGVLCEAVLGDGSPERDLRIMAFHAVAVGAGEADGDGEGDGEGETFLVALAFSDSTVRVYWYDRAQGFERLARGRYTAACLTSISILPMPSGETWLLTAATDGCLQVWQIPGDEGAEGAEGAGGAEGAEGAEGGDTELVLKHRTRIHQSSILALSLLPLGPSSFIICTGGDDNACALTSLSAAGFGYSTVLGNAHAAAVAGVSVQGGMWSMLADDEGGRGRGSGELRVASCGGDGRVRMWDVSVDVVVDGEGGVGVVGMQWLDGDEGEEGEGEGDGQGQGVPTSVADAAGMLAWREGCGHRLLMVFGTGVEVFEG